MFINSWKWRSNERTEFCQINKIHKSWPIKIYEKLYSQFIRQPGSITQRLGVIRDNKETFQESNLSKVETRFLGKSERWIFGFQSGSINPKQTTSHRSISEVSGPSDNFKNESSAHPENLRFSACSLDLPLLPFRLPNHRGSP